MCEEKSTSDQRISEYPFNTDDKFVLTWIIHQIWSSISQLCKEKKRKHKEIKVLDSITIKFNNAYKVNLSLIFAQESIERLSIDVIKPQEKLTNSTWHLFSNDQNLALWTIAINFTASFLWPVLCGEPIAEYLYGYFNLVQLQSWFVNYNIDSVKRRYFVLPTMHCLQWTKS